MSEETQPSTPSTEAPPPPTPTEFKVDDMVELLNIVEMGNGAPAMGQVVDPEGVDVEIFFSLNPVFKVGETYRGISEEDLAVMTPERVDAFEATCKAEAYRYVESVTPTPAVRTSDIDERLSAEIRTFLESNTTAEGFEAAAAMATAARDFIRAWQVGTLSKPCVDYTAENLARLGKIIGFGSPDDDSP